MENGAEASLYVIAAAVSFVITAISLIVMIVNEIRSHRQTIYRFDSLDKEGERLEARHDRSTTEHDRLSTEHSNLEKNLGEKLRDIGIRQDALKDKVFEFISRENGRRESLASILPQQDVLTQIQLLYDKILALSEENTKLKYQNRQLQEKLNHMHEEVSEKSRENGKDMAFSEDNSNCAERDADNHQLTEQEKAIEQAVDEIMSQEELPEQDSGMEHEM